MKVLSKSPEKSVFALIDGNSFYASCEIAFQPHLSHRPVVVLSNNDGCIVAANQIAKDLNAELMQTVKTLGPGGYRSAVMDNMMFQPYFKVKDILEKYRAAVFSSNYELYADMSSRMHRIVGEFAPRQEIYSIDESFLDLTGMHNFNLTTLALQIKDKVKQDIGIPVAVGIGHSKTLAKLANHLAKKQAQHQGVLDLTQWDETTLNAVLAKVDVGKVWGIGSRLSQQLKQQGVATVADLKQANPKTMRKTYGVVMERTWRELHGESCLSLEEVSAHKKQIISSRSFGVPITAYVQMEQAVVSYTCRAAEKLRSQGSVCAFISVMVTTNPFAKDAPFYRNQQTIGLIYPSDNSILLTKLAKRALKSIWRAGYAYHKAGVTLGDIDLKRALQEDIFAPNPKYSGNPKQAALMQVMDGINQRDGRNTLFLGASGIKSKNTWQMRRNLMSPRYTTRWSELLQVR
ncbi:Y-family DNA polymerase [Thiosulfativibrio zosterae]|uniref:DNA polymerase V subunit UmuC n=1 Tax=Thiosulfativibrio zosterae TaxID=2675053 RepID=A0A6F8PMS8_9GAMM|nr:Y-family DNA polymerase [Thiosulfativibrio zosterae]BBP43412.1 DNA polymerase V subunit UmuC [Thiosulfativibrio zosterae]